MEVFNEVRRGPWHAELAWGWSRGDFKELPHGEDRIPGFVWHQYGTTEPAA